MLSPVLDLPCHLCSDALPLRLHLVQLQADEVSLTRRKSGTLECREVIRELHSIFANRMRPTGSHLGCLARDGRSCFSELNFEMLKLLLCVTQSVRSLLRVRQGPSQLHLLLGHLGPRVVHGTFCRVQVCCGLRKALLVGME
jgi:hypothetical protein